MRDHPCDVDTSRKNGSPERNDYDLLYRGHAVSHCNLTLKATGTQQLPRSGNLLLCVGVGRIVMCHSRYHLAVNCFLSLIEAPDVLSVTVTMTA